MASRKYDPLANKDRARSLEDEKLFYTPRVPYRFMHISFKFGHLSMDPPFKVFNAYYYHLTSLNQTINYS